MRKSNILVFDDFVAAVQVPAPVYTAAIFNEQLGCYDQLAIMAVVDNVSAAQATVTIQIQHSADQRNWVNKNSTAEINARSIPTDAATTLSGSDPSGAPSLGAVRLSITLSSNVGAHMKIYITARAYAAA